MRGSDIPLCLCVARGKYDGKVITKVRVIYAWCGREMGEKPPLKDKTVTHSICPECKRKHFPKKKKERR